MYIHCSTHGGQECSSLSVRSLLLLLDGSLPLSICQSVCHPLSLSQLSLKLLPWIKPTQHCSAERTSLSKRLRWRESEEE